MPEINAARLAAAALRENHCSTKEKAKIIVTVTPEAAARTVLNALLSGLDGDGMVALKREGNKVTIEGRVFHWGGTLGGPELYAIVSPDD